MLKTLLQKRTLKKKKERFLKEENRSIYAFNKTLNLFSVLSKSNVNRIKVFLIKQL
jgi:hypothetical protein